MAEPMQSYDEEEYLQLVSSCLQFVDMGMAESYEEIFLALKGVDPERLETLLLEGIYQRLCGQHDEAIATLSSLAETAPEFTLAYYHLGKLYSMQGNDAEAMRHYTKCTDLDMHFTDAHLELARILQKMGSLNEALEIAVHALQTAPSNVHLWGIVSGLLRGNTLDSRVKRLEKALIAAMKERRVKALDIMVPAMLSFRLVPTIKELLDVPANQMDTAIADAMKNDGLIAELCEPFVLHALENITLMDVQIELVLRSLRKYLLLNKAAHQKAHLHQVALAMAHYGFNNEYVFYTDDEEKEALASLGTSITAITAGATIDAHTAHQIALYACYQPLYECENREALWSVISTHGDEALIALAERSIKEVEKERSYLEKVTEFAPIEDASSQGEKAQYEAYPYPRWTTPSWSQPMTLKAAIRSQMPFLDQTELPNIQQNEHEPFDVLIAGCGTGQHPFIVADMFPMARLFAMDFSKTCLAYAQMKGNELGYQNVEFSQGDILDLTKLGRQFDYVECVGVLHHVPKIKEAFQALADATKPGGWLKIGLYDYDKRSHVRKGWEFLKEHNYGDSKDEIRRLRYDLMRDADNIGDLAPFLRSSEFFSMSDCNGLMYHIDEHQMTLDALRKIINEVGLKFVGMLMKQPASYMALTEGDAAIKNWQSMKQWEASQKARPEYFHHMHMMMLQKPA